MSDSTQSYVEEQIALLDRRPRESDAFAAEIRRRTLEDMRRAATADPAAPRFLEWLAPIAMIVAVVAVLIAITPALLQLGRWSASR